MQKPHMYPNRSKLIKGKLEEKHEDSHFKQGPEIPHEAERRSKDVLQSLKAKEKKINVENQLYV